MGKAKELNGQEQNIRLSSPQGLDSGCITDIAALKNPLEFKDVVKNTLRSRSTLSVHQMRSLTVEEQLMFFRKR